MNSNTTTAKKPVTYEGTGSAIENYFSPKPEGNTDGKKWNAFDAKNSQHKYILSLLYQKGWTKELNCKTVPDMDAFGNWLKKNFKKPLAELSKGETTKVIFAFERVVQHEYTRYGGV